MKSSVWQRLKRILFFFLHLSGAAVLPRSSNPKQMYMDVNMGGGVNPLFPIF
jgi:hypothetical protein